ncbi:hypothetical protein Tfer_2042 [Thermincola ferriacetica]|uniref:Uncharacterized protein n=1 Tax=Thermincola ferriacetica TaxID=281456 RepID=A0A0L6W1Y0_9FIRM|nr:hypothetical protein Tfer_2042 [Thermincola ferriacetica]
MTHRFAVFAIRGREEILCGNCTYASREEAEHKLGLFKLLFEVRGYRLEIRPF